MANVRRSIQTSVHFQVRERLQPGCDLECWLRRPDDISPVRAAHKPEVIHAAKCEGEMTTVKLILEAHETDCTRMKVCLVVPRRVFAEVELEIVQ